MRRAADRGRRDQFLRYLMAAVADDPDAVELIADAAVAQPEAQSNTDCGAGSDRRCSAMEN